METKNFAQATGLTGVGQIIQQPLYDTSEMDATTVEMDFFTQKFGQPLPISGTKKTKGHTNMDQGGNLPAGNSFSIHSIQVGINDEFGKFADDPDEILAALRYETWLVLTIGDKTYLEIPVKLLSSGFGAQFFAAADASAAAFEKIYGQNGSRNPSGIFKLTKPIVLQPNQAFNVSIRFTNAPVNLAATQQVMCVLGGFLQRPVQ